MPRINLSNKMRKLLIGLGAAFFMLVGLAAPAAGTLPVQADDNQYVSWTEYANNPVFDPTEKAYYPSILFNGSIYQMWYDNGSSTNYTTSTDGIHWNGGVATTGLATNAHHPHVEYVGGHYMIWYWNSPTIYSIDAMRCAVSDNGINWNSDTALTQVGTTVVTGDAGTGWNRGTYGACDVFYNASGSSSIVVPISADSVWANKFVMYYDGTTGGKEDIGLAVSNDGINWQGYLGGAAPVLAHDSHDAWDNGFATFGTVLKIDDAYHMWYSGGKSGSNEGIGYATSGDGITWTKYDSNPIMSKSDGVDWRSTRTYTPMVLYDASNFSGHGDANLLKMWYSGLNSGGNYAIGYASAGTQSWLLDSKTTLPDGNSRWNLDLMTTPPGGSPTSTDPFVMTQDSIIWISDEKAVADVTFDSGNWTVTLDTEDWSGNCVVQIGDYAADGTFTPFAPTSTTTNYIGGAIIIKQYIVAGMVSTNDYLALQINNSSGDPQTINLGGNSYLDSPIPAPSFPLPEMSAGILLALGLAVFGGFMVIRRKKAEKVSQV